MTQTHYSLTWARDSFKKNICSGFSALQQNGEFVDMTIAADGHFVKVHQVIVALASPYLKNLMASAPCQHPIIFLNKISNKVLCYLLEYIYTGEVVVPTEYLASFTDAAKELHIKGLETVDGHLYLGNPTTEDRDCQLNSNKLKNPLDTEQDDNTYKSNIIHTTIEGRDLINSKKRKNPLEIEHTYLPRNAKKVQIIKAEDIPVNQSLDLDDSQDYSTDMMDDSGAQDDDDQVSGLDGDSNPIASMELIKGNSNLLYSLSIRGSLQVILNRYIYNLNSSNTRTGVRRWRCVHYRDKKCNAFVVTKGNTVVNRCHLHNHPFHDKKIIDKIEKKAIFSALDDVEGYVEKEKARDDKDKERSDDDGFDHIKDTSGEP